MLVIMVAKHDESSRIITTGSVWALKMQWLECRPHNLGLAHSVRGYGGGQSRCGRILVIEARQMDVGHSQGRAAADGHRALSGRGKVRKSGDGPCTQAGYSRAREGGLVGDCPGASSVGAMTSKDGVGSSVGCRVPELAAARLGTVAAGEVGK